MTWPIHPELLIVSEHRGGDFTLCVPTSVAELGLWSRRLWNCLDSFGPAVAHGQSWVIGIRLDDSLTHPHSNQHPVALAEPAESTWSVEVLVPRGGQFNCRPLRSSVG
jgi:hypothetical protein